jgi:hypothetical protein
MLAPTRVRVIWVTAFDEGPSHAGFGLGFWEFLSFKKGVAMSKHMARHHKKAAKTARAHRPLKRARGRKRTRLNKGVTQRDQVVGKSAVEPQVQEPEVAEFQLVNLETLSQEPEGIGDTDDAGQRIEIFAVEVVNDDQDVGQDDAPEITFEDTD